MNTFLLACLPGIEPNFFIFTLHLILFTIPMIFFACASNVAPLHYVARIRMVVASLRPDHQPTLSAAKASRLSLLVKHHILAIDEAS